jgi:hypothetical protein
MVPCVNASFEHANLSQQPIAIMEGQVAPGRAPAQDRSPAIQIAPEKRGHLGDPLSVGNSCDRGADTDYLKSAGLTSGTPLRTAVAPRLVANSGRLTQQIRLGAMTR